MSNYFNLFPNCVITRGNVNSLIVDYKSEIMFNVPSFVHDIIDELCQLDINEILLNYKDDSEIIQKIIDLKDWLITNNLGMMSTKSDIFVSLSNCFKFSTISNAVIEIENLDCINSAIVQKTLQQLIELECNSIQLILIQPEDLTAISEFLKIFNKFVFQSVELVIKSKQQPSSVEVENFIMQNLFLKKLYVFGCKSHNILQFKKFDAIAVLSAEKDYTAKKCGAICQEYFSPNLMTYFEGKKHNTCLNQKIAIDKNGNIKNCLSLNEIFGNVCSSSLKETVNADSFKKYWSITKDNINICKDCEFRYVCTDCRAFIEDPQDILSKPLKCGYDPHTGEWSSWQQNPLKKRVIDYYGL